MARKTLLLDDAKVRRARPRGRLYRLNDGGGLYLQIQPNGARYWRIDFAFAGKRKTLGLGTSPEVNLAEARARAAEIHAQIAAGVDPSVARAASKDAAREEKRLRLEKGSFEAVAREWHSKRAGRISQHTDVNEIRRLQNEVFPWIGKMQIGEIRAQHVLKLLQRIENSGRLETAKRVRQIIGQVLRYAVLLGLAESDPTPALKGAIRTPRVQHMVAVTDPNELGKLLLAVDGYQGGYVVRAALQLAPILFVRPGELRRMEWAELELDGSSPCWRIPQEKMKMREPHIVPLCKQAVAILKDLRPLTGRAYLGSRPADRYVFPSGRTRDRPMSENAVTAALTALGLRNVQSGHGFRATARTLLDERLRYRVEVIEMQLAHCVRDPLGRAYNRTRYIEERTAMMQAWADYLDKLRADARAASLRLRRAA